MTNNNDKKSLLDQMNNKDKTLQIPGAKSSRDIVDKVDIPKSVERPLNAQPQQPQPQVQKQTYTPKEEVKPTRTSRLGSNKTKPSKKDDHTNHRDMTVINIILTVLTVIANIAVLYIMLTSTQFAGLSKKTFTLINVGVMAVLVLLDLVVILAIRFKNNILYRVGAVLMALLLVGGSIGTYALYNINRSINQITNTVVQESVSASFVVYSENGTSYIKDVASLEGKTVGYVKGSNTGNLGVNRLTANNINASLVEYVDYSSELIALFSGDIDCAVLPTNYVKMFQNEAGIKDYLDKTSSILDFEESIKVENVSGADKDITKEPFTVLLVGNADGLSDTMIVCSINPISLKVTMSSIARDSYVPVTCFGAPTKLNASHAGGINCTISTIESLLGIKIDYYVDTNFQGVVDVVDALGGIVVNSPISFVGQNSSEERGHYTVYVPAGENVVLNGEQALAFARERHLFASGDFARQEHQQMVIKSILTSILRTRDINTFVNVLKAAGENVQTNLTLSQMTNFMSYVLQKANRYYNSDHIEDIFDIQNSRVTGYSSGYFDEGLEIPIYIYRLWNGSLIDTATAITRNIDMQSEPTAATNRIKWSANWEFTPDPISYDFYPEAQIEYQIPQSYIDKQNAACGVNQQFSLEAEGCICQEGFVPDGTGQCVDPNSLTPEPTEEPEPEPTDLPNCGEHAHYDEGSQGCVCDGGYIPNANNDGCVVAPTEAPTAEPTQAPTEAPTQAPTAEPTQTCWDGSVIPASQACPVEPTPEPTQTCWDGSVIPASQACPAEPTQEPEPTPEPTPEVAPEQPAEDTSNSDTGGEASEPAPEENPEG